MDKISLLHSRKQKILNAGKKVRADISAIVDEKSFVEFSAFSFSKSDFYDEDVAGDGVVCGFATIDGYSFCIVAQNYEILSGGVSKAACDKIGKCLDRAFKTSTPVIYLASSLGVQAGEGVTVLEGLASLLLKASRLRGTVQQYMIVNGEVYGQLSVLSALCDFTFFLDGKSVLTANSPLVIAAKSNENLSKFAVGGVEGLDKTNLVTFKVKDFAEIRKIIIDIGNLLSVRVIDDADLNLSLPDLDTNTDLSTVLSVFDEGESLEIGGAFCPEIRCVLGRIGGITAACAIFNGGGVYLNAENMRKMRYFAEFSALYSIPFIVFADTLGIKPDIQTNNSPIFKQISEFITVFDNIEAAKISVIYKRAIGLGYTLFGAKSMGYDYNLAFATAEVSLFDGAQGAEIELNGVGADKEKLAAVYSSENADPINTAKNAYIDDIIQPAYVRQYLISALQTLLK